MKSAIIFLFLFLFSVIGTFAQTPAEQWIQYKKGCGLDPNLSMEKWREQGEPCPNKTKSVVVVPVNDPNAAIAKAEADKKAKEEAEKQARAEAEAKKKKEEEERKEKQETLVRMNGTSTQTFGLNSSSPDFDGLKSGQTNSFGLVSPPSNTSKTVTTAAGTTTTGVTNNWVDNDPNVVDARNVPSGLSKDIEKAINDIYKDSPDVCAKVKKAFQSVQIKDWEVAKVWFQAALKLDPDNKGLQNFVLSCYPKPNNAGDLIMPADTKDFNNALLKSANKNNAQKPKPAPKKN
jgi:hypothetical protein